VCYVVLQVISARGYNLVDYESEIFREDEMPLESLKGELNELTKESWEVGHLFSSSLPYNNPDSVLTQLITFIFPTY